MSGRKKELTKQTGEYLVASELSRRGLLSTTFSGNIPEFDILATGENRDVHYIQVKAYRMHQNRSKWLYHPAVANSLDIQQTEDTQNLLGKVELLNPDQVWVFVLLGDEYGDDEFFIMKESDLQNIIYQGYSAMLKKRDGKRESTHFALTRDDFQGFRNNWKIVIQ